MKFKFKNRKIVYYFTTLAVIVILGLTGLINYYEVNVAEDQRTIWAILYDLLRLFFLENEFIEKDLNWMLNLARFIAPVFLATAFVDLVYNSMKQKFDLFIIRCSYKNHLIICGLELKSKLILESNFNYDKKRPFKKIVIIDQNKENTFIDEVKRKHVKIVIGDARDKTVLRQAGVLKAGKIYISTGNDIVNLEIVQDIIGIIDDDKKFSQKNSLPEIVIDFVDHANERLFKHLQDFMFNSTKSGTGKINVSAISMFQQFASKVIDNYSPDQWFGLKDEKDAPAEILIYGMNKLGNRVLYEAGQIYHFLHLKKTKVIVVDKNIEAKKDQFLSLFPKITEVLEIKFVEETNYWETGISSLNQPMVCFITGENDADLYLTAFRLRQHYFSVKIKNKTIHKGPEKLNLSEEDIKGLLNEPRIVVLSSSPGDTFKLLKRGLEHWGGTNNELYNFENLKINIERIYELFEKENGTSRDSEHKIPYISADPLVEEISMNLHAIFEEINGRVVNDPKAEYNKLTDECKDQNRWAARHLEIKYRAVGFGFDQLRDRKDIGTLDDAVKEQIIKCEHNRWMAERYLTEFAPGLKLANYDTYKNLLNALLKWNKNLREWDHLEDAVKKQAVEMTDLQEITRRLIKKQFKNQ